MSNPSHIQKTINVDQEALSRFEEIYPMHGAFTWFINEALHHFVELHEIHPSDYVESAISTTLSSSKE